MMDLWGRLKFRISLSALTGRASSAKRTVRVARKKSWADRRRDMVQVKTEAADQRVVTD
jgi:hypothetical protein